MAAPTTNTLRSALYQRLKADAAVAALVVAAGDARIYPRKAKQGAAFPRVTYIQIAAQPAQDLSGASGVRQTTLQIDSWAQSDVQAAALGEAIRLALVSANLDPTEIVTWGDTEILNCNLDDEADDEEDPAAGEQFGIFRKRQTYTIWHREALPGS